MIRNQHETPMKTPRKSPTSAASFCNQPGHFINPEFPATYCQCGAGICGIVVSSSPNNPRRKYYRCPGKYDKHCGYFKWCDELRQDEVRKSQPEFNFPTCECGAGVCTLRKETSGPNAGRSYFACPIKRGDGACNFRQWLDNSAHSAPINPVDTASRHNILRGNFGLSYEISMLISLAPIEQPTYEDSEDEELIRCYDNKRLCYVEAQDAYLRAKDAYKASFGCVWRRDKVQQMWERLLERNTSLQAAYADAFEPLKRKEKRERLEEERLKQHLREQGLNFFSEV